MTIDTLTDCPQVTFDTSIPGMEKLIVTNPHSRCEVYLHGAHITAFETTMEQPLLWLSSKAIFSSDKAIRGGIPICWPWFGDHPQDPSKPAHGFARTSRWRLERAQTLDDQSTELMLALDDSEQSRALWPYRFALRYRVNIGKALHCRLSTTNTGDESFELSEALHNYLRVCDIGQISVDGLTGVDYLDKLDGNRKKPQLDRLAVTGPLDRVYLSSAALCAVKDPQNARKIELRKQHSDSTIVWNPGEEKSKTMADMSDSGYRNMLCVEAGNTAGVVVAPGQTHILEQCLSVAISQ